MCISNRIGPPVEGADFFGRTREIRHANKLLDSGHSLLLSAPRRIGKSSLAKRLIAEKMCVGWKCVYIDLEEVTTEEGFLHMVVAAFAKSGVWKQITTGISKGLAVLFEGVEKMSIGPVDIKFSRNEEREELYKNLKELIDHEQDTFIVIDELTLFLGILSKASGGQEKVAFILNWLRSLRQISRTKVRWLFCGSVGLRNFTSNLNLGYTINDLTEFSLDELTREEAHGLLQQLCASEQMSMDGVLIDYTLNKLLWNIPYFIQIIFAELLELYDDEKAMTAESIDIAYNKLVSENYLTTWSERLVEYGELEIPARQILKSLSSNPAGLSRETLLNMLMTGQESSRVGDMDYLLSKVLRMLENDGYIMKKEAVRVFRSPLLRDYWFNTFVQ